MKMEVKLLPYLTAEYYFSNSTINLVGIYKFDAAQNAFPFNQYIEQPQLLVTTFKEYVKGIFYYSLVYTTMNFATIS